MSAFKYWLIIASMMLSMSATAGVSFTDPLSYDSQSQYAQTINNDFLPMTIRTDKHRKKPLFVGKNNRANTHRSVLFLADSQATPNFRLAFEFNPPDLSNARFKITPIKANPWFLQSSAGHARVSGWKDGNSLYTASITYHS